MQSAGLEDKTCFILKENLVNVHKTNYTNLMQNKQQNIVNKKSKGPLSLTWVQ